MNLEVIEVINKDEKWFNTFHLKKDLKSRSVKGGFNTVSGQIVSFLLSITSNIVMARLLAPNDFGLVAMVTAVTGFISIFSDLGLSAAVIQKENITHKQISAVFWINALISLVIALIIGLLAPVLSRFYNEERLFNITIVFAVSIFFTGLSLQHNALMKRQMKFKHLSLIQMGCTAISIIAGILLAWAGFGYWAIVSINVITPILSTITLWLVCDWRPDFGIRSSGTNSFLKFGAGLAGFDLVNYFSRNMDNVLIGKYSGSLALGIYSKAYQLLMLPINQLRNPLSAVALPALSSLQNDNEKYKNFYSKYLFILAFFSMPIVIYLAVFSEELILIVLGHQWAAASHIFRLLAIAAFIQPVAGSSGLILITKGRAKRYFRLGLVNAIITVSGFVIGIHWGMEGVAGACVIVTYLTLLPTLLYAFNDTSISIKLFFKEIFFPLIFSIVTGLAIIAFKFKFKEFPGILLSALGLLIGGVIYFLLWQISSISKNKFKQIIDIASDFKRSKSNKQ